MDAKRTDPANPTAELIRRLREALRLRLDDVAERAAISPQLLSLIERGDRGLTPIIARQLAMAFAAPLQPKVPSSQRAWVSLKHAGEHLTSAIASLDGHPAHHDLVDGVLRVKQDVLKRRRLIESEVAK